MARYKQIDMGPRLLPLVLEDQLQSGSPAHAGRNKSQGLKQLALKG